MPIYDYECKDCGHKFEELARVEDTKLVCKKCLGTGYRLPSAPNFRITGFNAKNGYNLPKESDLLNPDGTNKIGLKM